LKCDIPRASFALWRSDLQKCHKKTFVFSALLSVTKIMFENNVLFSCLKFRQFSEATKKQRKFPAHRKISPDLSTRSGDVFGLAVDQSRLQPEPENHICCS
jgi:hypothetical protein